MSTAEKIYTHPFTDSGLGRAPFRYVGMWSMPSPSLAEHNVDAYNRGMREMPQVVRKAHCSCEHCGMSLMHFCIIQNADGEHHVVGSTCIGKVGDSKLIDAATAAVRERQRKQRQARREAKLEANRIAREEKLAAERRAHGGATAFEFNMAVEMNEQRDARVKSLQDNQEFISYADSLYDGNGRFRDSMHKSIMNGEMPTGKGRAIVLEILAKIHGGRRGSKAYKAMHEKLNELLPEQVG